MPDSFLRVVDDFYQFDGAGPDPSRERAVAAGIVRRG